MTQPNPPSVIGTVEWEITEAPDWRTIHRGSRTIERDDIEIIRAEDENWPRPTQKLWVVSALERVLGSRNRYRQRIHLEGGFYLDLSQKLVEEGQRYPGFSLSARHEVTPTFSFDYFGVDGMEHATDRWGSELRVSMDRGRSGWEIRHTEFLTDVSLRMQAKDGPYRTTRTDAEPRWRVRIVKGSHVSWPSVDERVEPPASMLRPVVDVTYPDPSDAPGTIEWEITEAPNWRTIHWGSRTVQQDDVEIIRLADEHRTRPTQKPWLVSAYRFAWERAFDTKNRYIKRIHLEGGFYLDLIQKLVEEKQRLMGLGLSAKHETTPTNSFDFFLVDDWEHATNREVGKLRIGVRRDRSGWEFAYTEFLTDVSLRMAPKEGERFGITWTKREPRWRVRIAKGSRVYWPSVDERAEPAPPS